MHAPWSLFEPSAFLVSTGIILLSFVSEDAATFSSALLVFGGPITWSLGFFSCFMGIWLGDLGLYSIARCVQPVLRRRWVARFADAATIERCKVKFARDGSFALLASRFIPGTRFATYVAAGLFSMPAGRFALVTGIAALVWIGGIFALTSLLGSQALVWLGFVQSRIAAVVFTALLILAVAFVIRKTPALPIWRSVIKTARRWSRWEFWPAWLFYLPVSAYYVWLAIRYRGLSLPTAANPGMAGGGFVGESKSVILDDLRRTSPQVVAEAFLLDGWTTTDRLLSLDQLCRQHEIALPFILKPDVGQRGNGVRLVRSMRDAFEYLEEVNAPVILQRYASGRYEAGVFYFRFPGEARGQIFSITEKIFPTITGDGARTIEELIRSDTRASLIARTYLRRFADRENEILPPGEVLKLVETGNHAQGCIFREGGHLWTEALERAIDDISQRLPAFYVGRYDIRYDNEQDFRAGRNFQIVELNGASSEATSIYDSRKSLRSAYRTLFRQWELVFAIAASNRRQGHQASPLWTLWRQWRQYCTATLSYPGAS